MLGFMYRTTEARFCAQNYRHTRVSQLSQGSLIGFSTVVLQEIDLVLADTKSQICYWFVSVTSCISSYQPRPRVVLFKTDVGVHIEAQHVLVNEIDNKRLGWFQAKMHLRVNNDYKFILIYISV